MLDITYNNKTKLVDQPDIADENKVTDSDMNMIKNVTNTNNITISNALNGLQTYSTDEINTGKKWIDNKPIYRKVVLITTASTDITAWTNLFSIPNIDNLIECYGYFTGDNVRTPIPRYESESYSINFLVQNEYLKYRCSGFRSYSGYLIIEYTKTTN